MKWKVEMSIFTNGKGYEFTRDVETSSHSKKESTKENMIVVKDKDEEDEKVRWMVKYYTSLL